MFRIFLYLIFSIQFLMAQKGYPNPNITENLLFYIQHSSNHNTFVYEWSGDKLDPIKVYRINYEDKGQKETLSSIQKKFAYGVNYKNTTNTQFSLAAAKTTTLDIKSAKGKHWVELSTSKNKIKVERIFIQLDSKSNGINTKAEYIIVYGKNQNNKSIEEKIEL